MRPTHLDSLQINVLDTLSRLVTSRESGMPPPAARIGALHEKGVVNCATLLDICAIYCAQNRAACTEIIGNIWNALSLSGAPAAPCCAP
jgi:hypothetical protein